MSDVMSLAMRIRQHERMQQASALIGQVEDDLPHEHSMKADMKALAHEVWERGYELLGDVEEAGEGDG